jgi:hypothetical protein
VNELPDELIDELLTTKKRRSPSPKNPHVDTPTKPKSSRLADMFPRQEQEGPVRYVDSEMRCGMRGCSSATYIKVNGLPRCTAHALRECNSMLVDAGFRGV